MMRLCLKWKEFLNSYFLKLFKGNFDANINVTYRVYRYNKEPCIVYYNKSQNPTDGDRVGGSSDLQCLRMTKTPQR